MGGHAVSQTDTESFLDEVRRLKDDAARRTPTADALAKRLREIEQKHSGKVVPPPGDSKTDAA
jgi:hypothetical protein